MTLLKGLRVVDLSTYASGPLAALALADLGADVVKIEPPEGDAFRKFGSLHEGTTVTFATVNRNKQSVCVDLKTDIGRAELRQLIAVADVLLTNWRPGVAERLGFPDESVRALNPSLVWIRISGFGTTGPDADRPVFDTVIQARSGIAVAQGRDAPDFFQGWLADKITAAFATQLALAALVSRQATGAGRIIDLPMLDAVAYFNFPDMMAPLAAAGLDDEPNSFPQTQRPSPLRTTDGWIVMCPVSGDQLKRALRALGILDRVNELKGLDSPAAVVRRFYELAAAVTPTRSSAEWLATLDEHDVPGAPVLDFSQHMNDPQVRHNGIYREVSHSVLGTVTYAGYPGLGSQRSASWPAPDLDAGRDSVLATWTPAEGAR